MSLAFEIDEQGTVHLGPRRIEVPRTVSAEAQAFLAAAPWGPPQGAEVRPMWESRQEIEAVMMTLNDVIRQIYPVTVEETRIGGVRCHVISPLELPAENAQRVLINIHSGGFVFGSGWLAEAIPIAHLAKMKVIAVDYRLAPEHPFPAAVDDVLAVYREVLRHHAPRDVAVYGSSAGGTITGQLAARLLAEKLALPACLGIFTAPGDLGDFGDSAQLFSLTGFWGEPLFPLDHPFSEVKAYLVDADPKDPLVSPLYSDLAQFPPTLLMTGTRDALLSGASIFHRALKRAGADAELIVFEAMPHGFWNMPQLPESREALQYMVDFFVEKLDDAARAAS
jgi:acetyl esterase/lipase